MEKRNKIIYWASTGLFSAWMLFSAAFYFINTSMVEEVFVQLGYNTRIVIPLAIIKILGIVAILTNKSRVLKEWAYFGFLVDFLLAFEAHIAVGDGNHITVLIAIVLWVVSYSYNRIVYKQA